eukprot:gene25713-46817_t
MQVRKLRLFTAEQRGRRRYLYQPGIVRLAHGAGRLAHLLGAALAVLHHAAEEVAALLVPVDGRKGFGQRGQHMVFHAVVAGGGVALDDQGFEAFEAEVRRESWSVIETESGLSRTDIEIAAEVYARAERVIACWGMGITQHEYAVHTIQTIANWLMLRGNLGRPGAGVCPVRGHSNVQGDRTMMIYERPPAAFLDRLGQVFNFEPPREDGYDTMGAIEAMLEGKGKVFFAMGGNFAAATPDTVNTFRALRACDLTVHVATKFNRSHVVHGRQALVLPCLGRPESDVQ